MDQWGRVKLADIKKDGTFSVRVMIAEIPEPTEVAGGHRICVVKLEDQSGQMDFKLWNESIGPFIDNFGEGDRIDINGARAKWDSFASKWVLSPGWSGSIDVLSRANSEEDLPETIQRTETKPKGKYPEEEEYPDENEYDHGPPDGDYSDEDIEAFYEDMYSPTLNPEIVKEVAKPIKPAPKPEPVMKTPEERYDWLDDEKTELSMKTVEEIPKDPIIHAPEVEAMRPMVREEFLRVRDDFHDAFVRLWVEQIWPNFEATHENISTLFNEVRRLQATVNVIGELIKGEPGLGVSDVSDDYGDYEVTKKIAEEANAILDKALGEMGEPVKEEEIFPPDRVVVDPDKTETKTDIDEAKAENEGKENYNGKTGRWDCPHCEKNYKRKSGLTRHLKDKHAGG